MQIDPSMPPTIPEEDALDTIGHLTGVLNEVFRPDDAPLLDTGVLLWRGLSLIVVVWTGLRVAFSGGSYSAWDIVQALMSIWIPWVMLEHYVNPITFGGFSARPFPRIIPAGGNWLADFFASDSIALMQVELTKLYDQIIKGMALAAADIGVVDILTQGIQAVSTLLGAMGFLPLFFVVLLITFLVSVAQVLVANIAIQILIFLGPIFIPFLVFPPLAFLFWGWFKSLFTYSLYAAIAGALLRVWCGVSIAYVQSLSEITLSFRDSAELVSWMIGIGLLAATAVMSTFKIPAIASGIAGAGGADAGGVFTGVFTAGKMIATGGKSAAIKAVPKG